MRGGCIAALCLESERQGGKHLAVTRGESPPLLQEAAQPAHLAGAERGLNVGQAIVESEKLLLVIPAADIVSRQPAGVAGDAVRTQQFEPLAKFSGARGQHST